MHYVNVHTKSIQHIVEFAKSIKVFMELQPTDQIVLLRAASFEIMYLRNYQIFNQEKQMLYFDHGYINQHSLKNLNMHDYVQNYFTYLNSIKSLNLNHNQLAILSGIMLFSRDRPDLNQPVKIDNVQEKLIQILKKLIVQEFPNNDSKVVEKLHNCLSLLRPCQFLHRQHCLHVINFKNNFSHIKLPPLYTELFIKPDYISLNLPKLTEYELSLISTTHINNSTSNSSGISSDPGQNNSSDDNEGSEGKESPKSSKTSHTQNKLSMQIKRKQSTPTGSPSKNFNNKFHCGDDMKKISPLGSPKNLNLNGIHHSEITAENTAKINNLDPMSISHKINNDLSAEELKLIANQVINDNIHTIELTQPEAEDGSDQPGDQNLLIPNTFDGLSSHVMNINSGNNNLNSHQHDIYNLNSQNNSQNSFYPNYLEYSPETNGCHLINSNGQGPNFGNLGGFDGFNQGEI